MHQAQILHQGSGKAARVFAEFSYRTRKSWSCARRVVAKAEYLDKDENPRFVVTSLTAQQWAAQDLYEKFYCARGEMENRIKEQMCLFADRLSTDEMKGNQLRLYLSALAYTLIEALRRLGLKGTAWAEAQVDTIRLKLLKMGAIVRLSVRRVGSSSVPSIPGRTCTHTRLPRPTLLNSPQHTENSSSTCVQLNARQSHEQNTRSSMQTTFQRPKPALAGLALTQNATPTTQISTALTLKSAPMRKRG
jgi:hypothetical protein